MILAGITSEMDLCIMKELYSHVIILFTYLLQTETDSILNSLLDIFLYGKSKQQCEYFTVQTLMLADVCTIKAKRLLFESSSSGFVPLPAALM